MSTLKEIFLKSVEERPSKPFLGSRKRTFTEAGEVVLGEYQWKDFKSVSTEAHALARYLQHNDMIPQFESEVGKLRTISLYSKNREEWAITDISGMISGTTIVTLYDTLGKDSIEYILNQTECKTVVCEAERVQNIVSLKKDGKINKVAHIIYMVPFKPYQVDEEEAKAAGLTITKFKDAVEAGMKIKEEEVKFDQITHDTYYTFCYTSGTTGMAKGVMLTHRNFVCNVAGLNQFDGNLDLYEDDVQMSFLPLAHVFERMLYTAAIAKKV